MRELVWIIDGDQEGVATSHGARAIAGQLELLFVGKAATGEFPEFLIDTGLAGVYREQFSVFSTLYTAFFFILWDYLGISSS